MDRDLSIQVQWFPTATYPGKGRSYSNLHHPWACYLLPFQHNHLRALWILQHAPWHLFRCLIGPSQVNNIIRVIRVGLCDPLGRQRNTNPYMSSWTNDEEYLNGNRVSCPSSSRTTNCQENIWPVRPSHTMPSQKKVNNYVQHLSWKAVNECLHSLRYFSSRFKGTPRCHIISNADAATLQHSDE